MSDIIERLRSQSILKIWHPMMLEAADEIERQRKVISAMIEDCQYLKDKQIEAAAEIEKLREALKPFAADTRWLDGEDDDYLCSSIWFRLGQYRAAAKALGDTE